MKNKYVLAVSLLVFLLPAFSFAAKPAFIYGGWLPFWEKSGGVGTITANLDKVNELSPFSYEVNPVAGTLKDSFKTTDATSDWLIALHDLHIAVIPTVAWLRGDEIHALLVSKKKRRAHEAAILKMVTDNRFDGVDIDYEDKSAKTKPYFSAFIKELAGKLHPKKKKLACTIEPRTPAAARFTVVPPDLEYANDYKMINAYCDEVRIMAYDQGRIDLLLNNAHGSSTYYAPLADTAWIKKVLAETLPAISRRKIVLGIPTYGYEYQVGSDANGITYKRLRSVSYDTALELAAGLGIVPQRNSAGELNFTYSTGTPALIAASANISDSVASFSTSTMQTRLVWFTDAASIADKIKLAKSYRLRGIFLFKLDGRADPLVWNTLKSS